MPRPARTIVTVGADLAETTCRACRSAPGFDQPADDQARLAVLFVLAITLGIRPGELRALRWDHIDLDHGMNCLHPNPGGCKVGPRREDACNRFKFRLAMLG